MTLQTRWDAKRHLSRSSGEVAEALFAEAGEGGQANASRRLNNAIFRGGGLQLESLTCANDSANAEDLSAKRFCAISSVLGYRGDSIELFEPSSRGRPTESPPHPPLRPSRVRASRRPLPASGRGEATRPRLCCPGNRLCDHPGSIGTLVSGRMADPLTPCCQDQVAVGATDA